MLFKLTVDVGFRENTSENIDWNIFNLIPVPTEIDLLLPDEESRHILRVMKKLQWDNDFKEATKKTIPQELFKKDSWELFYFLFKKYGSLLERFFINKVEINNEAYCTREEWFIRNWHCGSKSNLIKTSPSGFAYYHLVDGKGEPLLRAFLKQFESVRLDYEWDHEGYFTTESLLVKNGKRTEYAFTVRANTVIDY